VTLPWREHPKATEELLAAVAYYEEQRAGLGVLFDTEIMAALADARAWPGAWPPDRGSKQDPRIRSRTVAHFPFRIIYIVSDGTLVVLAYAHRRREPSYWLSRLED
jgi:hypothetical protein